MKALLLKATPRGRCQSGVRLPPVEEDPKVVLSARKRYAEREDSTGVRLRVISTLSISSPRASLTLRSVIPII